MKRSLIALALTGLFASVAFAEPTLSGDDSYDAVHLQPWKSAPEAISHEADKRSEVHEGIFTFNP